MVLEEPADTEQLNVADTRPAMMLGIIPMELGAFMFVSMFAINNQTHSLFWGPAIVGPFALLAAVLVRRDYNGVRIFSIWLRNVTVTYGAHAWGGATVSPDDKKPRHHWVIADDAI